MRFKSQSQVEHFRKAEAAGEIAPGTVDTWLKETPNVGTLPIRLMPKQPIKAKTVYPYTPQKKTAKGYS